MGSHGGKCLPLGFTIPFPKCEWPKHVTLECFASHRIHGLQSRPPSPKRAERKVRRRPFREAGSGQNNGTR